MTREERIALLKTILSMPTYGADEKSVADYLQEQLDRHGIRTEQVEYAPGRNNLVAEMGISGPVLALSGHMDVVPPGDLQRWSHPPFEPIEKDGKLYARGATDMKSGLAAMVAALIELADEKTELSGRVRLLATVGEEVGLLGAEQLTQKGYANDIEALIIGEPTGHRIIYAHKGICTITVSSLGKSAHSSMPDRGVNAIDNLLVFYNSITRELAKLNEVNDALGKLVYCNSIMKGGEQFNIVPEFASLTTNLRTIPETDNERVIQVFKDTIRTLNQSIPNMNLQMTVQQSDPPVFSDIHSKLVRVAQAQAKRVIGNELPLLGAPGATDAAKFVQGNKSMQIIVFGPGSDTMHQANEYVDIDNYLEMIGIYKGIVSSYLKPCLESGVC